MSPPKNKPGLDRFKGKIKDILKREVIDREVCLPFADEHRGVENAGHNAVLSNKFIQRSRQNIERAEREGDW